MNPQQSLQVQDHLNRRVFLGGAGGGLGYAALASLMQSGNAEAATATVGLTFPNFPPKAKRIIYLFQSGRPRRWICSIRNRRWRSIGVKICPSRFGRGSG